MSNEKVAYLYPSPYSTSEDGKINAEPPTIAFKVSKFPCVFDICANIGLAFLKRGYEYKITTNLFFGETDLTNDVPEADINNHLSHSTKNDEFVATFSTIIDNIKIDKAGEYRIKCALSRTPLDGDEEDELVHEQECFFVISDEWMY